MTTIVHMLIVCWGVQSGVLVELWRIEKDTPRPVCWAMNQAFSAGGPVSVITVKCTEPAR